MTTPDLNRFHAQLLIHQLSQTQTRNEVFLALQEFGPGNVALISSCLRGQVSRATIYRALSVFCRTEIAVLDAGRYELTDRFIQHRHYFTCRNCGRRIGFNDKRTEKALEELTAGRGLVLEDHRLSLAGLCRSCAEKPHAKPKAAVGSRLRRLPG